MIKDKFNLKINKKRIFKALDIKENTTVYEEAEKEFEECRNIFFQLAEPICLYEAEEKQIESYAARVYVLLSLGNRVSEKAAELFEQGEYFKGFVFNGICDGFLMEMDKAVLKDIEGLACIMKIGLEKRFYPHENAPSELMAELVEKVRGKSCGININESFVLSPSKSIGFVIGGSYGVKRKAKAYNCKSCLQKDCKWRWQCD